LGLGFWQVSNHNLRSKKTNLEGVNFGGERAIRNGMDRGEKEGKGGKKKSGHYRDTDLGSKRDKSCVAPPRLRTFS